MIKTYFNNSSTGNPIADPETVFFVFTGAWDINDSSGNSGASIFGIVNIEIPPQYTFASKDYDVAIITVDSTIDLSGDTANAICLARADTPFPAGSNLTISGWGKLTNNSPEFYHPIQQKTNVLSECDSFCGFEANPPFVPARQFCASQKDKGFCDADVGGPAFETINGVFVQFGIISHQTGCGTSPGYYTKIVGDIKSFIENYTGICLSCPA